LKVVAYCRVSTNKEDQLNSLDAQQNFFADYAKKNGYDLVKIYADEGKSGTKMKNRPQLLRLLSNAGRNEFDLVLIKDVSRLARNTVDFLMSIRRLKELGVKVLFVNYDQTSSESSEFMLTLLSAIAQEESANTSKRIKFGKKINAEKGKVPNIVYGYDKIIGDHFNLNINEFEADIVRRIYQMYTEENWGAKKISNQLNKEGVLTKRNCKWSQNAISRIVTNEIYIGNIINGKQEVADFLTGVRNERDETDWMVIHRPEFRIIDDETFKLARKKLDERTESFNITGERRTDKYVFTKLIRCAHCNYSFRRVVHTYKNTFIRWVCSGRNTNGADSCDNKTTVDEAELLGAIKEYFASILKDKPNVINSIVAEFNRQYKQKEENLVSEKDIANQLNKARKSKQKYMTMYDSDIIELDELREKSKELNETIERLENDLILIQSNISKSDVLETALVDTFKDIETVLKTDKFTNEMLSRIIEYITVDKDGNVDVYLKMLSDVCLDNTFTIMHNDTQRCN